MAWGLVLAISLAPLRGFPLLSGRRRPFRQLAHHSLSGLRRATAGTGTGPRSPCELITDNATSAPLFPASALLSCMGTCTLRLLFLDPLCDNTMQVSHTEVKVAT